MFTIIFPFILICSTVAATTGQFVLSFNTIPVGNVNHGVANSQLKSTFLTTNSPGVYFQSSSISESLSVVWLSEVTAYPNGTFSEQ